VPTELATRPPRTPAPAIPTGWSCPATVTGMPTASPDQAAPPADTRPITAPAGRTGGNTSVENPRVSPTSAIHARAATS
jgi:hypothetical protein